MSKNDDGAGFEVGGPPAQTLTPLQIQQKEFGVARFGGYRMRDVDEFLDQVTDALSSVIAENERLRRRAGSSGGAVVGAPDLNAVSRQADEIVQRARDEAARLVADARARAESLSAGSVAGAGMPPGDRAAVSAFLTREREFLQSLAALVQDHAEGVKAMARRSRDETRNDVRDGAGDDAQREDSGDAGSEAGRTDKPAPAAGASAPSAGKDTERSTPMARAATETPRPPSAEVSAPSGRTRSSPPPPAPPVAPARERPGDEPTMAIPPAEPLVVGEPEPASARPDRDRGEVVGRPRRQDRGDGDPSLRELFWGEES
jgi:DivIVA domain-containing protein